VTLYSAACIMQKVNLPACPILCFSILWMVCPRLVLAQDKPDSTTVQLDEVLIRSQTVKEHLEASPLSVQVINMQQQYDRGGDVSDVLNRSTGVQLRTDGGLGSSVQVNLGGLQGKAIRIFKDGLPVELFGHGFGLGTIPTNMLERVEIFKGAMPVYLASDALGGGINLVTRKPRTNLGEVSYEIASFNTHRVTTNLFLVNHHDPSLYAGLSGSFNYSDNNYKIHVPLFDPVTNKEQINTLKRFHDATRAHYIEAYAGVRDKKWADDLRLTLIQSNFFKEIQHDAQMRRPFGDVFSKEQNYAALTTYQKALAEGRLKLNAVATYSHFDARFIDTARTVYNWDGTVYGYKPTVGEITTSGNDQTLDYDLISARINAAYSLSDNHFLELSSLTYYQRRTGSDPLGGITPVEEIDVLTVPAVYRKNIAAVSWRANWWNETVESITAVKYFRYSAEGYTTDKFNFAWKASTHHESLGYLAGLKWSKNRYLAKMSYEYANRLPDEYEVFGDARLIEENLDLKPERSHNINLNMQYDAARDNSKFMAGAGLFYRRVKDIIFLQPDIPFNRYINFEEAAIKGVELETSYAPIRRIESGFNVTYQDVRRINVPLQDRYLEDSRVANLPFFFGNFWLNTDVVKRKNTLSVRWNTHYMHRFFLQAIQKELEPPLFGEVTKVETDMLIPGDGRTAQVSHDAGLYYHFTAPRVSLSAECRNLSNTDLYDNFNVQRPGRSFHLKIVYQFL
jgi:outer membrane receptor protein involved in Fe transport